MGIAGAVCIIVGFISSMWMVEARIPGVYSGGAWQNAHATFYGGSDASGTMGIFLFQPPCLPHFFPIFRLCFKSFCVHFGFQKANLHLWL